MSNRTADAGALGACPECETALADSDVLIVYESAAGRRSFAECPRCRSVVHPA